MNPSNENVKKLVEQHLDNIRVVGNVMREEGIEFVRKMYAKTLRKQMETETFTPDQLESAKIVLSQIEK